MRSTIIAGLEAPVSQFSFGTGSLHRIGSTKAQIKLVECAAENGFTHFDTAPLYGFGLAEAVLGRSALPKRDDITFATKVGIYPPGGWRQTRAEVLARKLAGKVFRGFSKAEVSWAVDRAAISITLSMRRLRRRQIDIVWMHEPAIGLIDTDEWRTFMARQIDGGQVRNFGFAGENGTVASAANEFDGHSLLIQTRKLPEFEARSNYPLLSLGVDFSYGYLGAGVKPCVATAKLAAAAASDWSKSIIVTTSKRQRLKSFSSISDGVCNDYA